MPKKWTRGERKEHLKEKYRHKREKFFTLVALVIIFVALLALLGYGISAQADPFLLIVLAVIILILVPVSVFLVDTIAWEQ